MDARKDAGFSIVEVLIAMFLLAVIAVAILPALWQGVIHSAHQSSTATATRYLNSLVEDARGSADCTQIGAIASPPAATPPHQDGRGVDLIVSGTLSGCTSGGTARLYLKVSGEGKTLASTTALIYIP